MGDETATRPLGRFDAGDTLPHVAGSGGDAPFGNALGRYLVLGVLGRGGMGIVYEAYDPVLDRKIAVKLLREVEGRDASTGRTRMHREAQALARLSHPNVITVHDVSDHQGAMYIAMELVQGATLRDWQAKRPWREVLGAYLAAARGLAAAHEAGLIHRDFKPDNVLVGNDGRVRVTDFGLARLVGDAPVPADPASPSRLASNLTEAGAVVGTLWYMAPEQIDGAEVDARSDQCSWCIAAWEALYGEQPFVGDNLAVRSAAMKSDTPKPPASTRVPSAIARTLQRGLAPDPAQRWPSMRALIDELERVISPRRKVVAIAVLATAAAAATVFALGRHEGATRADCGGAGTPVDEVWAPAVRAEVTRAFAATGAPYASDSLAALDRALVGWTARWRHVAVESCEASRVHGTQTATVLDLRTACLLQKRDELANTVGALAHADARLVESAATAALPDLDACSDVAVLAGRTPPPRDMTTLHAIEGRLDAVERELAGGLSIPRANALTPVVDAEITAATKLAWPPLLARARRDLARVQFELGQGKAERATLLAAAASASAAGDPDELVEIYLALAEDEARLTSEFALGDGWVELAAGTLAHTGPRPAKQVAIARARGLVAEHAGSPEAARTAYADALPLARSLGPMAELAVLVDLSRAETTLSQLAPALEHDTRALDLARAQLGDKHPRIGQIEHDLGTIAYRAGHYADSLHWFERALAVRRAAFGADSIEVANTIEAKGNAELALDQVDAAEADFMQAIHLLEARLGPDHPDVANAYNDIGGAYHRAGHYEQALANSEHVLALREKALGPDHPDVAQSLVNTAIEAKNLERWNIVDANYPRAVAIFEKAYGKDSIEIAITMINLGEARRAQGALDAARITYERARDIMAKQLGESHPMLAHVWNGLGQVALARGDVTHALPLLERAVAMRERDQTDATDLAESRFALARALPASDHARAVQLATLARDAYRTAGAGYANRLAAVEAWLK